MSQNSENNNTPNSELVSTPKTINRFILHPSPTPTSQISGHLLPTPISDHPVYEALSYNHDPSTLSTDLSLDDAIYHSHFLAQEAYISISLTGLDFDIPETVYNALLALRHHDKERALWIDAICLSEDELRDKRTKSTITPGVFAAAERVLVWLGNETTNSKEGIELLNLCARYRHSFPAFKGVLPLSFVTEKHINGLVALVTNPCFDQLWIIQELLLAPAILLVSGAESAPWYALYHATATLCAQAVAAYPRLSAVQSCQAGYLWRNWRCLKEDRSRRNTLDSWLCLSRDCTGWEDKRERVFAVLGVSCDGEGVEVDYERSREEIAREVVRLYEGSSRVGSIKKEVRGVLGIGGGGVVKR